MAAIALERRYEEFIKRQLDTGRFESASEVVQAGLEMLEDFDEAHERWLQDEIPSRMAEIKADPSKGIPVDEVFGELEVIHQAQLAQMRK
ncbi:type II toxin-antitoxin system ParD family antitoxin [Rhizobium sp. TH2]|uniref:ribbon-helix-helix domain-containing protein n=1 Tax=Rhizobium sp. TH2 TaxID=2775403 RepID=UPI002157979A|nr:type II toxin-antitoxin system ParD family antitoxin [Rhizobium sp. TH2]UVC08528.1 type II toxin-antitoxin system ParD family antitoxin [Rhizobium sp. TH2]